MERECVFGIIENDVRRIYPMANKYCFNCGEPVAPGMKRCPVCGTLLPASTYQQTTTESVGLDHPIDRESARLGETSFPSDPDTVAKQPVSSLNYNYEDSGTLDLPAFDEELADEEKTELHELPVQETPELSRSARRAAQKVEYEEDNEEEEERYIPKKKKVKQPKYVEEDEDYDDDDDDYDEDDYEDNPHTGLIIFLIVIIVLLLAFSLVFFLKPSLLDQAFSLIGINTNFSGEVIQTTETPEISPTITADASTTAVATAETTTDPNAPIGKIRITVERINVRSGAGLSNDVVGTLTSGEEKDFYEVSESDGYQWYRIGENQWVATDGSWITEIQN